MQTVYASSWYYVSKTGKRNLIACISITKRTQIYDTEMNNSLRFKSLT